MKAGHDGSDEVVAGVQVEGGARGRSAGIVERKGLPKEDRSLLSLGATPESWGLYFKESISFPLFDRGEGEPVTLKTNDVSGGQPNSNKRLSSSSRTLWPLRLGGGEDSGEGMFCMVQSFHGRGVIVALAGSV